MSAAAATANSKKAAISTSSPSDLQVILSALSSVTKHRKKHLPFEHAASDADSKDTYDTGRMRDLLAKFSLVQPAAAAEITSTLVATGRLTPASTSDAAMQTCLTAVAKRKSALADAHSRLLEGLNFGCKFFVSPDFIPFITAHPEVKAVIDVVAPEYLALRKRAMPFLIKGCACPELNLPSVRTNISSIEVMFALRRWLMRYETLNEAQAETLIRAHVTEKVTSAVVKKTVASLLETAAALTKWIQNSKMPRESFTFVVMPKRHLVLMETGAFAAAHRRCIVCAKAGVCRCPKCGLVWYCSKTCQEKDCTRKDVKADVKSESLVNTGPVKSTEAASRANPSAKHGMTCKGPAVDRSVFQAAQRVLSEGFQAIESVADDSRDCVIDRRWQSSDRAVRKALYEAAAHDRSKSK
jgi:hypothetical protein